MARAQETATIIGAALPAEVRGGGWMGGNDVR